MSANPEHPAGPEHGGDPSMEDILASIRRILNEEEPHAPAAKDVLELTPAMRVEPEPAPPPAPQVEPPPEPAPPHIDLLPAMAPPFPHVPEMPPQAEAPLPAPAIPLHVSETPPAVAAPPPEPVIVTPPPAAEVTPEPTLKTEAKLEARTEAEVAALVAPAAAAAAAASMGELVRRLANSQNVAIHRGGPTLEDMVREEVRGLLKTWLDENLPRVVERLVRAEIERVVGRHVG